MGVRQDKGCYSSTAELPAIRSRGFDRNRLYWQHLGAEDTAADSEGWRPERRPGAGMAWAARAAPLRCHSGANARNIVPTRHNPGRGIT